MTPEMHYWPSWSDGGEKCNECFFLERGIRKSVTEGEKEERVCFEKI